VDLIPDVQEVLDSLIPRELPVLTTNMEWFLVRIMPYRTLDNVIDGVVLTFSDITSAKKVEEALLKNTGELQTSNEKLTATDEKLQQTIVELRRQSEEARVARDYAQSIVDTVREPLIVLNGTFEVVSASTAFYQIFEVKPEDTLGKTLFTLGNNQWDIPRLHDLLENVLPKNRSFENFIVEHKFPGIGQKKMLLNAREIIGHEGAPHLILLAMEVIAPVGDKEEKDKPGTRDGKGH